MHTGKLTCIASKFILQFAQLMCKVAVLNKTFIETQYPTQNNRLYTSDVFRCHTVDLFNKVVVTKTFSKIHNFTSSFISDTELNSK